ncbi:ORF53 [Duck adenovirus 3]|uniref:ORF53 n=3 Tax=Duck aviadenovirus B TaxID=1534553 RepID=A0A5F2P0K8_9ADEN|nr:ORF53 [Duck adenovirus 2]AYH52275.1 ORF53 [Duck adenovirus 3]QKW90000.1 ORF53 [Duck aviadenovirus B]AYH52307.1 ORF53 [Duck adenovirus 3]AYH52335.1 ORF53 [Duck adenovirus 3]
MAEEPIPLDSVIIINDDDDDVVEEVRTIPSHSEASSSNGREARPLGPDDIGVISFKLPYIIDPLSRHDFDIDRVEALVQMDLTRAVLSSIGEESDDHGRNIEFDRLLEDIWADVEVRHCGAANGYWDNSYENGHMMECIIHVSAPNCHSSLMDCLLYVSSRLFRFGRRGGRMGRYHSVSHGIRVEYMDCMRHIVNTLFCVPNKNEN